MTTKEQARIQVLNGVMEGKVSVAEASGLMGVSERHTWRLLAAYRGEGPAAVAHGNRGRKPPTTTCPQTRQEVRELTEGPYAGFNHTHLTEMLAKREGIKLSRSTIRRILLDGGMRSLRRRRAPRRYSRRERYPQEGMLLQIDGSRHDWLQGRGPHLTLVGAVDDATGTVPFALFRQQEDAHGYMLMLKGIIDRHGVPLALYNDRHSLFQRSPKEPESLDEQLRGRRDPTQFGRALEELDIRLIMAHTPQAKGRIERAWDTFQDRLVSELRLAGVKTIEQANQVLWNSLPRYNQRFGVAPAQPGSAYRQLPAGVSLDAVLSFKYLRTVGNDNTVRFNGAAIQILPDAYRATYAHAHVEVQERRQHRSDPPGQDLGSRAGTCWTCRAQGSQRPALQRTATRRDRRQLQWPSLPHPADAPASQKDRRPVSKDRKALAHRYRALNAVRLKAQLDDALETLWMTADRHRDHHPSVTVSSDATYAPR